MFSLGLWRTTGHHRRTLRCIQLGFCTVALHRYRHTRDRSQLTRSCGGDCFLVVVVPLRNMIQDRIEESTTHNPGLVYPVHAHIATLPLPGNILRVFLAYYVESFRSFRNTSFSLPPSAPFSALPPTSSSRPFLPFLSTCIGLFRTILTPQPFPRMATCSRNTQNLHGDGWKSITGLAVLLAVVPPLSLPSNICSENTQNLLDDGWKAITVLAVSLRFYRPCRSSPTYPPTVPL